jgi:hypothetical protein
MMVRRRNTFLHAGSAVSINGWRSLGGKTLSPFTSKRLANIQVIKGSSRRDHDFELPG